MTAASSVPLEAFTQYPLVVAGVAGAVIVAALATYRFRWKNNMKNVLV